MGVDIFGTSTVKVGKRGPPGPAGSNNLKELIKWFPVLALDQIRKNVNFSTFLVETLPPDNDWDVELKDNRVVRWRSFNHLRDGKMICTPIDAKRKGSILKRLVPPLNPHQRYGLKFEGTEQNMYHIPNAEGFLFLRNEERTVLLTLTFLVGALPSTINNDDDNDDDDDDDDEMMANGEEFILNDYAVEEKTPDKIRGISIVKNKKKKFDLYLHGARRSTTTTAAAATTNRLKIGLDLKTSWFYTLQVQWGARDDNGDGESFYALYENAKLLRRESFQYPSFPDLVIPAFNIGGFKSSTAITKCFTGVLSNLEILQTDFASIPSELLTFIVRRQTLLNTHWLLQPPAVKRMKVALTNQ